MNKAVVVCALVLTAGCAMSSAATFSAGNLVVSQFGDGSVALASGGTAVFLKEISVGGSLIQTLNMPTTTVGAQRRFVNSGTATSEGFLTLSGNGQYLTLAGYDAALATASITTSTSAAVNRVVGRVDMFGNIDTSTALTDAISGANVRSVVSTNGTDIWVAGNSTGGGIRYATFGSTTSTALTAGAPTNLRVANIFSGQLYISSATGTFQGISTVGAGSPTTSGQVITALPGFPTAAGPSPYDFFMLDANTIYVADDRVVASGGGLQKWVLSAGTWSLAYTLNTGLPSGLRGLTATVDGLGVPTFYATTAQTSANNLVAVTDTGAGSSFSILATAPTNTVFRGVDFAPTPTPGSLALLGLGGLVGARRRR